MCVYLYHTTCIYKDKSKGTDTNKQMVSSDITLSLFPPTVHRTASLPPALSTSSTLMIVLDTCTPLHHLLTLDTLMYLKKDVCTDILSLVAYGTPPVRESALKLLLHYWPLPSDFSRNIYHYGGTYEMSKFFMLYMVFMVTLWSLVCWNISLIEWQTPKCENPACRHGNAQASTVPTNTCFAFSYVFMYMYMMYMYIYDVRVHVLHVAVSGCKVCVQQQGQDR